MRKLKVKILPNVHNKSKWYYGYLNSNHDFTNKDLIVKEYDNEPIFIDCYRYDNGTSFIDKNDCIILETL